MTEEENRLEEARSNKALWRKWGPYLSERQWGSVREDYSDNGDAWNYLPHDHARSRAYRWGEDGLAGFSDDQQRLCFALALWNEQDPILKERLFGLTSTEGNHGEDIKEYCFYLDNLPSHAYMKWLYKYPQRAYPYAQLLEENRKRTRHDPEYELLDTGIFEEDKYYDVFTEYAKSADEDILIQVTVYNRGSEIATLHLLPTLWFRNTWSWDTGVKRPELSLLDGSIRAVHPELGEWWMHIEHADEVLFTENDTNNERLYKAKNASPYVKDAFHEYLIHKKPHAVNPAQKGTKAAPHYILHIAPGQAAVIKLRLSRNSLPSPFDASFSQTFKKRIEEADAFYHRVTPDPMSEDMRNVQRQAFAGLLWNKQCYHYNVLKWLKGDPALPPPPEIRKEKRNHRWTHLDAFNVFSMPDKWEYPWFAAWDLCFHAISLALIDPEFAKHQLLLLTREWYMHPDGQIPAYEWSFSDVNPPVQAWAAMRVYQIEKKKYGREDRVFLEKIFQKLTLNFTWWVNRKDAGERNIFEGGFLGLDNIGVFDRSLRPPEGGMLEQSDGTGWMGMYCLNLLQIALELSKENPVYQDMATKFLEHFFYIAHAINNIEGKTDGLWDEEHNFYHGLLTFPDGRRIIMHTDSLVGIVPLFSVATNEPHIHTLFPEYRGCFQWYIDNRQDLLHSIGDLSRFSKNGQILISLANPTKLKAILQKVLDEQQFLSPFGIRSVSKVHESKPFILQLDSKQYRLDYEPAESTSWLFGGNSNWRGPVWFPMNYLLIESLQKYDHFLGEDFTVEFPTGSGHFATLWDVGKELSHRLIKIFLKDEKGHRPVYGNCTKFQQDPYWKDLLLFHEYFHGDTGFGLGASNQTGWTGLVAKLIDQQAKGEL